MKKTIPLIILETIEPVLNDFTHIFKAEKKADYLYYLLDADNNSDFFYRISKQEVNNGKISYLVEFKPRSKDKTSVHEVRHEIDGIVSSLKRWMGLIEGYNLIKTVYDDTVLNASEQRLERQYAIVDEDAKYAGFDIEQQLFLDEYLTTVKSKVEILKVGSSEEDMADFEKIEGEVNSLQKDLTKETKKNIIKRLAKIWARAQKIGLPVVKEIFISVVSEIGAKLLTGGSG